MRFVKKTIFVKGLFSIFVFLLVCHPLLTDAQSRYIGQASVTSMINQLQKYREKSRKSLTIKSECALPAFLDRRYLAVSAKIKNQGNDGSCWAYAAVTALENNLLPKEKEEFSVSHMLKNSGYYNNQGQAGSYNMAMAYLCAWKGPVYQIEPNVSEESDYLHKKAVKHVQEVQLIESKNYKEIKKMIFLYGEVQSSMYFTILNNEKSSSYYNKDNFSYFYNGKEKPNHDIVIVGWDDNYDKNKFIIKPEKNGAFICQNSWGNTFGDNGFFYVSYYDTNIGTINTVYTKVEEPDNYDRIYQSDEYGWVGQLGYGNEDSYFANVFTAEEPGKLMAVGFYATGPDTDFNAYVIENFKDKGSFERKTFLTKGHLENAGYYTIPVNVQNDLIKGQKFAVVIRVHTPNSMRPVAVEFQNDAYAKRAKLGDGEGYISLYGSTWKRTESVQRSNVCLKAYCETGK